MIKVKVRKSWRGWQVCDGIYTVMNISSWEEAMERANSIAKQNYIYVQQVNKLRSMGFKVDGV